LLYEGGGTGIVLLTGMLTARGLDCSCLGGDGGANLISGDMSGGIESPTNDFGSYELIPTGELWVQVFRSFIRPRRDLERMRKNKAAARTMRHPMTMPTIPPAGILVVDRSPFSCICWETPADVIAGSMTDGTGVEAGLELDVEVRDVCEAAFEVAKAVVELNDTVEELCTALEVLTTDIEDCVEVDGSVEMMVRVRGPVKVKPPTGTLTRSPSFSPELSSTMSLRLRARSACRRRRRRFECILRKKRAETPRA